jgi:anaerobic ribonucleoside-triphosphate reductase
MKLLGYHLLWYYAEKRYGKEWADNAITMLWNGDLYFHDAHGIRIQMPYCYTFSLDKIVFEGRPYGTSPNTPPKHRKSFISQVDKLISDMSKQFAGATAPSDFFLWYAWYCQKEGIDPNTKEGRDAIIQDMQGLVCLFNDASRAEGEPPFTNISIYDHIGLNSLFGHIVYPDHTVPDMEYIMSLQRIFCEWFSNGDPITDFPYRFPVVTQNLTTDDHDEFVDEEHARWVAHVNRPLGNFNLHFGKKNKLAMCPMHKDTEIFTKDGWVKISDLKHGIEVATVNWDTQNIEWHIPTDYQKVYTENIDVYENNWHSIKCDPNHPLLTKRNGVKLSKDITTSDKLVVAKSNYTGDIDRFAELVGFYIGDGYLDGNAIMFGFKKERKIKYLTDLLYDLEIEYTKSNPDAQGIVRFRFYNDNLLEIANSIGCAKDKFVPNDMLTCGDMPTIAGIFYGLMNSDGSYRKDMSRSQFITTSDKLKDDFCAIATMMGYTTNERLNIDHEFVVGGKKYTCDRCWYISLNNGNWKNMSSNKVSKEYNDYTYCITVKNSMVLYRLDGKTFVQHQCRYENDIEDMEMTPDSFGNGGVNIGSHRVITPNYPRAAIKANGDPDKFIEVLDEMFDVCAKLLHIHRIDILQKRIDRSPEYLQYFGKLGWFSLDTMFSTFGVTGIYEAVKYMGYDILDDEGTEFAMDMMAYIKDKCKFYRKKYNCTFNAEEIPGEQACVTLLQKDRVMYEGYDFDCELWDTNQYNPLINDADMITRIDLSGRFMKMISGGGIVHANCEAPIDTDGKMYEIMKFAAKSGVPHIAVCYRFGKCTDHKATIIGQGTDRCPICGKPIVHTRARVIGYFSDEFNWNPVRQKYDAPNRHYSGENELKEFEEE